MKRWLKWAFLGIFITAGAWAAVIAPQAALNMLPEVETVFPVWHGYREVVRGAGVIYSGGDDRFFLSAAVREGDINAVGVGQSAEIYGPAIDGGEYNAIVLEIADYARQQEFMGVTETVVDVILEIISAEALSGSNEFLRSGYTAEAVIGVGEPREILLVPYEAVNQDDRGEYVLVLAGNTALRRDIITGLELAEGAEILAGIREGDELIVRPERFAENMLVKPMGN
ncbi:MAG: efflux RND transporter periplasmic adaptor subunit [Oscillospiraceae bacterium]|jgi:hypothetical protein|nr:efflux RND transporter periplasmic adaptor subunit [Oscillospiraceae bacterium]